MEEDKGVVYGLGSPVSYKIRVVGQTTRPLNTRLTEHVSHALNGRYVCEAEIEWVRALAEIGLRPFIVALEECAVSKLDEREMYWINYGQTLGWNLLNENKGGKGNSPIRRKNLVQNLKGEIRKNEAAPAPYPA